MKLVGSREAVRSPEFHKKRTREKVWRAVFFVASAFILVAAPVFALRDEVIQVKEISVTGNTVTKTEDIMSKAQAALSGDYLWVVPKSNTLLYPRSAIVKELLTSIPRLASVNIALSNATGIKIDVIERQPYALYCSSQCYFLDKEGFIFSSAPSFSNGVYMIYKNEPAFEDPLGQAYLMPETFSKLDQFVRNLPRTGITPQSVKKSGDEYEATLKEGPVLKWREGQNLDTLYTNLKSFLLDSSIKKSMSQFGYIDLRFDNKIYYK